MGEDGLLLSGVLGQNDSGLYREYRWHSGGATCKGEEDCEHVYRKHRSTLTGITEERTSREKHQKEELEEEKGEGKLRRNKL